jgi:hypothetical protein
MSGTITPTWLNLILLLLLSAMMLLMRDGGAVLSGLNVTQPNLTPIPAMSKCFSYNVDFFL